MPLLFHEVAQISPLTADQPVGMTTAGWIFVSVAWITIISLAVFCYRKVLQKALEKRQHQLLESAPVDRQRSKK